MAYILALDQGTTSSRAILFNHSGTIVSVAQQEFQQIYPNPGWVEHDPLEILSSQQAVAVECLVRAGVEANEVAALGITNQRETVVIWERATGRPIHNAIVWQDRRTANHCAELKAAGHEADVRARTGLVLDPYFSATKAAWILDHVPGARARAEAGELAMGTIDTWLIWNLTNGGDGAAVHVTDQTNASRTLLYNIVKGEWDEDLLKLFRDPDVKKARARLEQMANSLNIDIMDVPRFLEDYGDTFLSLSFYRHCLDRLTPYFTACVDSLAPIRTHFQLKQNFNLMKNR